MIFSWLKDRRRRELLQQPFPQAWETWLAANVGLFPMLPAPQQARLRDLVKVFTAEKNWEGCGGQTIDDEIRVTVAAQASLLVLAIEPGYYFDGVASILVYPDLYLVPERRREGPLVVEDDTEMLGQFAHEGAISLSWKEVLETGRDPADGQNLVMHEFAHYLDAAYGRSWGFPEVSRSEHAKWRRVIGEEYDRLVRQARRGRPTLLDQYGVIDEGEFFAVATECFFERPHALRRRHQELYRVLQGFYRQDPAAWHTGDDK
jgi:Mlc titration factor MtfA (ptsG expression regulator)